MFSYKHINFVNNSTPAVYSIADNGFMTITCGDKNVRINYGKDETDPWNSDNPNTRTIYTNYSLDELFSIDAYLFMTIIKADVAMKVVAYLFDDESQIQPCDYKFDNEYARQVGNDRRAVLPRRCLILVHPYREETYTLVVMRTNQSQPTSSVIDQISIDNYGWFSLWDETELESNTWSSGVVGQIMAKFTHSEIKWPIKRKFKLFSIINAEDSINVTWQAIMNKIHNGTSPLSFELLFGSMPADCETLLRNAKPPAEVLPAKAPIVISKPALQTTSEIRGDTVKQELTVKPNATSFNDQVVKPFERIKKDTILYTHMLRDVAVPSEIECSIIMLNNMIHQDTSKWSLEDGVRSVQMMCNDLFILQKYIVECRGYTSDIDDSTIDLIYLALFTTGEVGTKLRKALDKHGYTKLRECVGVFDALTRTVVAKLTKDKLLALLGQYNKLSQDIEDVEAEILANDVKNLQLGLELVDAVAPLRKYMISRIRDRFPHDYNFDHHDDEFIHLIFSAIHKTTGF